MITICIPTLRPDAKKQMEAIVSTISSEKVEIFASCQKESAAYNRNYCLNKARGEIIIMLDDDITGFFPGWDQALIKPLLTDKSISMVAARLMDEKGEPTKVMYNNFNYEAGYYPPRQNVVSTGCVAFRRTGVRFDEQYTGWGYEDTDFCKQMELASPDKRVVINNDCKLTHPSTVKERDPRLERINRRYYHSKWGLVSKPKKPLATVIYYTGNSENEAFENKVRDGILRVKGASPLISVSQKPIDFGKNICVGDVGQTYLNAFRQCLIGCEAATTPFVIMTESDCLYPRKGYFDFEPTDPNTIYSYDNVWLMWNRENRTRFYKHGTTQGSVIYGREFIINLLKESLKGLPMWSRTKVGFPFYKPEHKWEFFHGEEPLISVKTRQGVSWGTTLTPGVEPKNSFPYWGTVEDVKGDYDIW